MDFYGEKFITTKGFVANVEILLKLRNFNVKAAEVPLLYRYDLKQGYSKMKVTNTLIQYLKFIFKTLQNKTVGVPTEQEDK